MRRTVRRRRKRLIIKPRFLLVLIITAAIIFGVVLLVTPKSVALSSYDTVTLKLSLDATVIRDEACYSAGSNFDRAAYLVPEGSEVVKGTSVATIYKWGYSDDGLSAVYDAEKDILAAQNAALTGIASPDLEQLNAAIDALTDEIITYNSAVEGKRPLLKVELELKQKLLERKALLLQKVQETEELTALYHTRDTKEKALSNWTVDIISAGDGKISYYFDGFEPSMNAEKLKILSSTLVQKAIKNAKTFTASDTEGKVYRIIKDGKWYVAFVTKPNSLYRLYEGQNYEFSFSGYESSPLTGNAVTVKASGDYTLNILEVNAPLGDFISIRTGKLSIRQAISGVTVKTDAVSVLNGRCFVTVMRQGQKEKVEVNVLAASDKYCVISGEGIVEGQQYIIP